jgi:hypothetical protein
MAQQIGQLVAASCPIVALVRPYGLGVIVFQAVLLLLQQNMKYRAAHILDHLPH